MIQESLGDGIMKALVDQEEGPFYQVEAHPRVG